MYSNDFLGLHFTIDKLAEEVSGYLKETGKRISKDPFYASAAKKLVNVGVSPLEKFQIVLQTIKKHPLILKQDLPVPAVFNHTIKDDKLLIVNKLAFRALKADLGRMNIVQPQARPPTIITYNTPSFGPWNCPIMELSHLGGSVIDLNCDIDLKLGFDFSVPTLVTEVSAFLAKNDPCCDYVLKMFKDISVPSTVKFQILRKVVKRHQRIFKDDFGLTERFLHTIENPNKTLSVNRLAFQILKKNMEMGLTETQASSPTMITYNEALPWEC